MEPETDCLNFFKIRLTAGGGSYSTFFENHNNEEDDYDDMPALLSDDYWIKPDNAEEIEENETLGCLQAASL